MEKDEYRRIANTEERIWWFRALHANLKLLLHRFLRDRTGMILDGGCGTGGFIRQMNQSFSGLEVVGLDMEPWALSEAREKSRAMMTGGSVNELPFPAESFIAYISADVLYHRNVDPEVAVKEAYRCLKPGGIFVVNVPAYQWLFGAHDRRGHGARRFTRRQVVALLSQAGFRIVYASYWNMFLFPLMVLRRKLFTSPKGSSELTPLPSLVEAVFSAILAVERKGIGFGVELMFGGSILMVGVR